MADTANETQYARRPAYPELPKPRARPARPASRAPLPAVSIGMKGAKPARMPEPAQIAQMLRVMAGARHAK